MNVFYYFVYKRLTFLSRNLYCIYTFSLHSKNKTDIPGKPGKPNKTNKTNKPGKPDIPNITDKPNKPDIPDKPGIPVLPGAVSVDRHDVTSSIVLQQPVTIAIYRCAAISIYR